MQQQFSLTLSLFLSLYLSPPLYPTHFCNLMRFIFSAVAYHISKTPTSTMSTVRRHNAFRTHQMRQVSKMFTNLTLNNQWLTLALSSPARPTARFWVHHAANKVETKKCALNYTYLNYGASLPQHNSRNRKLDREVTIHINLHNMYITFNRNTLHFPTHSKKLF